jgi:hypothetical protein
VTAIGWAAFILTAECIVLLAITPLGTATAILAALTLIFFTITGWAFGAHLTPDSRKATP